MHTTTAATGFVPGLGPTLPVGTALGSVTSMVIDPFNAFDEIIIGIGDIQGPNINVPASITGGAWYTVNGGASWLQVVGQNSPFFANNGLPNGVGVGRVTVAMGAGGISEERYTYFLIANPSFVTPAPVVDYGSLQGLYKSSDNMR